MKDIGKVLIIEDNEEVVEAVSLAFQMRWPQVKVLSTDSGEEGLKMLEIECPDVVILDLGLPDISGFEVLKQVRLFSSVPIIILTVRGEERNIVKGLESGADDYIVKPFRQLELVSRVKAVMRRGKVTEGDSEIVCGPLHLDLSARTLYHSEKQINLTRMETIILEQLMRKAGCVVPHASLAETIWGHDYPAVSRNFKVHIRRLRKKIELDPGHPRIILTRSGVGYLLARPS